MIIIRLIAAGILGVLALGFFNLGGFCHDMAQLPGYWGFIIPSFFFFLCSIVFGLNAVVALFVRSRGN